MVTLKYGRVYLGKEMILDIKEMAGCCGLYLIYCISEERTESEYAEVLNFLLSREEYTRLAIQLHLPISSHNYNNLITVLPRFNFEKIGPSWINSNTNRILQTFMRLPDND